MQEKRTMRIVKLVTALATLVVVVLVGIVSFQTIKMKSLQRKQQSLDEQILVLESQLSTLQDGIVNRTSPIYIEETARNDLGMLDENEDYFVFE